MARKRPEPPLTELLASWPRQRQKARGGTSVARLHSLCIPTALFANTLDSFSYRLQNRRTRRKSRRNDPRARLPFALWPPAFEVEAIKPVLVYRCTIKHSYSETDEYARERHLLVQTTTQNPFIMNYCSCLTRRAITALSYHQLQRQQRSARPSPKYRRLHSPMDPSKPSVQRLQQISTLYFGESLHS